MAEIGNIEKKKGADKRSALLALVADKGEATTRPCLSSEEMATLLEEKCDASSRQELLAHLAQCQTCYEEWSVLRAQLLGGEESGQRKKRGKLLHFISRPKNMAIWGSALTAVASLLFVLNTQIHKQPVLYHEELTVAQKPAGIVNETEQLSTTSEAVIEPEQVVQQPAPSVKAKNIAQPEPAPRLDEMPELAKKSMAVSRQKEQSPGRVMQAEKQKAPLRPTLQEKKKKVMMAEVEASNGPHEETMLPAESHSLQEKAVVGAYFASDKVATSRAAASKVTPSENATLTLPGWIEQVEKACLKTHYDGQLWKQLLASGKMLEQQYQNKRLSDEQFIKVLDCVKRMDGQESNTLCEEIKEIMRHPSSATE